MPSDVSRSALSASTPSATLALQSLNNAKMNAQRLGLRLAKQLRSPSFRSTLQRRLESTTSKLPQPGQKLVGPQDNAFNRERAAVKAHAAATSGTFWPFELLEFTADQPDRSLAKIIHLVRSHPHALSSIASTLTVASVVIPCLILATINAKNLWDEHWEHWSHLPPLEERIEYPYQNLRTRNFFWGDGDKVSMSRFATQNHGLIVCSRRSSGMTK